MLCLPENAKMQHIARKFGDRVSFEDGDVEVRIATEGADAQSIFAELLDDTESAMSEACWQSARGWVRVQESERVAVAS
jgi:hypothetical protein